MKRPLSELEKIEKKLNKGRGSTIVSEITLYCNLENPNEEEKALISYKWDVLRQYPEVIQWFKDNGLEPK